MNKKYVVQLNSDDRKYLNRFVSTGKHSAMEFRRAMTLFLTDRGKTDEEIHNILGTSTRTIERTREKYVTKGLDSALHDNHFYIPFNNQVKGDSNGKKGKGF